MGRGRIRMDEWGGAGMKGKIENEGREGEEEVELAEKVSFL